MPWFLSTLGRSASGFARGWFVGGSGGRCTWVSSLRVSKEVFGEDVKKSSWEGGKVLGSFRSVNKSGWKLAFSAA